MIYKILKLNILFILISFTFLNANEVKKLDVSGNKRLSKETIQVLGNIELNKNFTGDEINEILKSLYATDFFEDIKIDVKNETLLITVNENPIIQNVTISGNKKDELKEKL